MTWTLKTCDPDDPRNPSKDFATLVLTIAIEDYLQNNCNQNDLPGFTSYKIKQDRYVYRDTRRHLGKYL